MKSPGKVQAERLSNGLSLISMPRAGVPLASLRLALPAGAARARSGAAELSSQLLRRGCRGLPAKALDELLERLGSEVGIAVDDDATRLSLTVPSARLGPAAELLARLWKEPTFPEGELKSLRRRTLAQIQGGLDQAEEVADRALFRTLFEGHPYSAPVDGWIRDVAKLRRTDALLFHRQWLRPAGACLVLAGDLPAGSAARVARAFGGGPGGEAALPLSPPAALVGHRVVVVDKPDATQTQIRIGGPGFSVHSPDLVACHLGNAVLGGGFSSRLVGEVRVRRGLTYGISSRFHAFDAGGCFAVRSFTRTEEAATLIRVSLDEIARLREEGPRDDELEGARAYLRGSFLVGNETAEQLSRTLADSFLRGLGLDWIDRFPRLLGELSRADVTQALGRHLLPGPYRIVAEGPARQLVPALRPFGEVVKVALNDLA